MGDKNWGKGILEQYRESIEKYGYPPLSAYDEFIDVEDADTEEEFLKNAEKAWLSKHGKER